MEHRKITNLNSEFNILQNIHKSAIFLFIFAFSVIVQVILAEVGWVIGFETYGLSWLEWLMSIVLGALSIPLGFALRVIPGIIIRFVQLTLIQCHSAQVRSLWNKY